MSSDLPTQKKNKLSAKMDTSFSFPLNIVTALIGTGVPRNCSYLKTHRLDYMKWTQELKETTSALSYYRIFTGMHAHTHYGFS